MVTEPEAWDPRQLSAAADPLAALDDMRRRCPVAHDTGGGTAVFRHHDVMHVLSDPEGFSNRVSRHLAVPNGMDGDEHRAWRKVIDPHFDAVQLAAFAPACSRACEGLVAGLGGRGEVEVMAQLAEPFAVRVQCAFLGWPEPLERALRAWMHRRNTAAVAADGETLTQVAHEFDDTIRALLVARRRAPVTAGDVTDRLMATRIHGRAVHDEELVSILRNWTVGELGTIAASVGIIVHFLAAHPLLQALLRAQPERVAEANDEILRLHGPLLANRRMATAPCKLGAHDIAAGARLTLHWASANRDEEVFADPGEFAWGRDPHDNLLYGAGVHACPGASLARMELAMLVKALLAAVPGWRLPPNGGVRHASYPVGGYVKVPIFME